MELIIVSGFLGSGKTTLLLSLAKHYSGMGRKVAVIENEIGRDGIDGELLKAEGLNTREIYSGCICCSLRCDLTQTLLELEREFAPDIVFMEPSGVASPNQIRQALLGYGGEIDRKTMIVVADAERLPNDRVFSLPIVQDGIRIADIMAITKTDLVDKEQVEDLERKIADVNADVALIRMNVARGTGLDGLISIIGSCEPKETVLEITAKPNAVVFAATFEMDSVDETAIAQSLTELSLKLDAGVLIGHIKAILKTKPAGYSVFSVTQRGQPAVQKGRMPSSFESCTLTINAIVYGMEEEFFKTLCADHFRVLNAEVPA